MRSRLYDLIAVLVVLVPSPAVAAGAAEKDVPPTVKLVLHPVGEPTPALRYHLLPPLIDRRPGNAAVLYGKVTAENMRFFNNQELSDEIVEWLETPLAELSKQGARVPLHGTHFKFLESAARCEYCDWQLPIREEKFFEILLPEVQQTRTFGRMLAAKARMQIAQGEYDEAVHTLQTGYALGRHVGRGPTLVNGLVGIAIAKTMSKQVETFVQQPGAPNLYWALTHLPDPLIDMRPGFEAEWAMIYLSYQSLYNLDGADYSAEQWRELLGTLTEGILQLAGGLPNVRHELLTTALALRGYPLAKQALLQRGYTAAEVEAMPVAKVILLHTMQTYEESRDDLFKWFAVPYWQAREGLEKAEEKLHEARDREVIPIASILLPAIQAAHHAGARSRRTIAALRVVEAIRMYGAAHDRNLPEKLNDITEVPIPDDPTTGQPFIYRRTGKTAVLESPGGEHYGLRYQITFAPEGKTR